jgi:NifU-like protein involved in Fe-S cluster formation
MALAGTRRSYHENIVEHYENPRNVGSLDKHSSDVGTVSNCTVHDTVRRPCLVGLL